MPRSEVRLKVWGGDQRLSAESGFHLEKDEIFLPTEMLRHRGKRFPIDPLVIDANSAPVRFIGENLEEERRDPGSCFSGTGIAGDEPAPAEILAGPFHPLQASDDLLRALVVGFEKKGEQSKGFENAPDDP